MELYEQLDSNTMIKIIILLDGTTHTTQMTTVHGSLHAKK